MPWKPFKIKAVKKEKPASSSDTTQIIFNPRITAVRKRKEIAGRPGDIASIVEGIMIAGRQKKPPLSSKALSASLNHENARVRRISVWYLGQLPEKKTYRKFVELALRDRHYLVRCEAAQSLGLMGNKKSVKVLKKSLKSEKLFLKRKKPEERLNAVNIKVIYYIEDALKKIERKNK